MTGNKEGIMAGATSLSLAKFTDAVHAAVRAAVQKHPKFKMEAPSGVTVSYLIRGIPVPEQLVAHATVAETRAFAADIAAHLGGSGGLGATAAAGHAAEPVIYSHGSHVIIGIPAITDVLLER
jgi:hypothetical protein